MYKFKQSLLAFAGILLLVTAVALLTPQTGLGQKSGSPTSLNVNVVNTEANPVPVAGAVTVGNTVTVVEAPKQPFDHRIALSFQNDGANATGGSITPVPQGKQLVVTYFSAQTNPTVATKVSFRVLKTSAGGSTAAAYDFESVETGTVSGFVASEPLHIYLNAGESLSVIAARNTLEGVGAVNVSVSGYLVDVPAPPAQ